MSRARVLVVEPDARLGRLLARYLAHHDIDATVLADRGTLGSELRARRYACVVLDAGAAELPAVDLDGATVSVVAGRSGDEGTRVSPREILAAIDAQLRVASSHSER